MVNLFSETVSLAVANPIIVEAANLLNVTVEELARNGAALLYKAIHDEINAKEKLSNELRMYIDLLDEWDDFCSESRKAAAAKRRELQKEVWRLNTNKSIYGKAIKELKAIADPATKVIMKLRDRQYNEITKAEKPAPEGGRTIEKREKIELGRYKVMNIPTGETMKEFMSFVYAAEEAADKEEPDMVSLHMSLLAERIQQMIDHDEPIRVNASNAHVNPAAESMAARIAGVRFDNKVTDKIMTVAHNVRDVISPRILKNLGAVRHDAEEMLDSIKENLLYLMKKNGIEMTMLNGTKKYYDVWAASASQLKDGEFYAGERSMMNRTADVRNILITEEEMKEIEDNGPEMLKRQAVLFTPAAPMKDANGNYVRLRDVTMCKSIETNKFFKDVLDVDENGDVKYLKKGKNLNRALFDGGAIALDESLAGMNLQGRGFGLKFYMVAVINGIAKLAKRKGYKIPETIETLNGTVKVSDIRILMTTDTWKWGKLGLSWPEFVRRVESLKKRFPMIDCLMVARYADSTEESPRSMARQAMQQFINATGNQLKELAATSIRKLAKYQTATGMLSEFAQLNRPMEERTAYNRLFELAPSILASKYMSTVIKDMFDEKLATYCSGSVPVNGIYPYITEDPAAVLEILVFGKDPNTLGLGFLKPGQINIPNCEEGRRMVGVRYPANLYTLLMFVNHNDDFYATCGNTAILCVDDEALIRADGDVDGDEMALIFCAIIIAMMDWLKASGISMPLVAFPHGKAPRYKMATKEERDRAVAHALFIANKFGLAVGQNSLMATRFFNQIGVAFMNCDETTRRACGMQAMWAYIGSVLAIDLAKTGSMPAWLEEKLKVAATMMGKLPWNQRFKKHSMQHPWYDSQYWDVDPATKTGWETKSTCDRLARIILNGANAENYKFDTEGLEFDVELLLSHQEGLHGYWSDGVVDKSMIASLEARNFRDGEDRELITAIYKGERISAKQLFLFFWRNLASLKRHFGKTEDTGSKTKNAEIVNTYYAFVRKVMINFGDNEKFQAMTPDQRRLTIVNAFVRDAFEVKRGNGIGNNYAKSNVSPEALDAMVAHAKGSYVKFTLSVFAPDICGNVEENLGIPEDERFAALNTPKEYNFENEFEMDESATDDCGWYSDESFVSPF